MLPPAFDALTQTVQEGVPKKVKGQWVQQWTVVPLQTDAIIAGFDRHLEAFFLAKAQERRYSSISRLIGRAGYPGPFQAEGIAFGTWMDACNAICYAVMADVLSGKVALPTWEDLMAQFLAMEWPEIAPQT